MIELEVGEQEAFADLVLDNSRPLIIVPNISEATRLFVVVFCYLIKQYEKTAEKQSLKLIVSSPLQKTFWLRQLKTEFRGEMPWSSVRKDVNLSFILANNVTGLPDDSLTIALLEHGTKTTTVTKILRSSPSGIMWITNTPSMTTFRRVINDKEITNYYVLWNTLDRPNLPPIDEYPLTYDPFIIECEGAIRSIREPIYQALRKAGVSLTREQLTTPYQLYEDPLIVKNSRLLSVVHALSKLQELSRTIKNEGIKASVRLISKWHQMLLIDKTDELTLIFHNNNFQAFRKKLIANSNLIIVPSQKREELCLRLISKFLQNHHRLWILCKTPSTVRQLSKYLTANDVENTPFTRKPAYGLNALSRDRRLNVLFNKKRQVALAIHEWGRILAEVAEVAIFYDIPANFSAILENLIVIQDKIRVAGIFAKDTKEEGVWYRELRRITRPYSSATINNLHDQWTRTRVDTSISTTKIIQVNKSLISLTLIRRLKENGFTIQSVNPNSRLIFECGNKVVYKMTVDGGKADEITRMIAAKTRHLIKTYDQIWLIPSVPDTDSIRKAMIRVSLKHPKIHFIATKDISDLVTSITTE